MFFWLKVWVPKTSLVKQIPKCQGLTKHHDQVYDGRTKQWQWLVKQHILHHSQDHPLGGIYMLVEFITLKAANLLLRPPRTTQRDWPHAWANQRLEPPRVVPWHRQEEHSNVKPGHRVAGKSSAKVMESWTYQYNNHITWWRLWTQMGSQHQTD